MFGYVQIDKMELKVREYMAYKGYYCGLCMALKKNYGQLSRLTLNYDMTYLILILTSLYEPESHCKQSRCIAHPQNKQLMIENEVSQYAAAINVLLAYNNLKDNWKDEHSVKSLLAMAPLKRAYKKASERYPHKNKVIIESLETLETLEKEKCNDVEKVASVFGGLMGELLVYKDDNWKTYLHNIGLYMGKYIYILDAYDDLERDKKNKSYNPFLLCEADDLKGYAEHLLQLNVSFLDHEIEKLPLIHEKTILDNIIYSGMKNKMRSILDKDNCKQCKTKTQNTRRKMT